MVRVWGDLQDKLYGPNHNGTVYDRFPGKEGVEMEEMILRHYQFSVETTLSFYDDATPPRRLPVDHPLNQRDQEVIVEEYAQSIMRYGNAPSVRSAPWA